MTGPRPWRGAATGLSAAALFGLSVPISKGLLPSTGPVLMAALLYLGAGGGLLLLAPLLGGAREARLRRADLPLLLVIMAVGGVLGPILEMLGLARLSGAQAALLLNLEAPFAIGLAVLAFGESLSGREALGAAVVLAGGAALSGWPSGGASLPGAAAVAGACACWALDSNLSQRLSHRDPVTTTGVKSLAAGAVNLALALALGERLPPAPALGAALLTGFLGYGVSMVLYVHALRRIGTARQAAYFATAPFMGALAAVPFLGDRLGAAELLACALMAAGLALLLGARHEHEHRHERLEHDHAHDHDEHHRHRHEPPVPGVHAHPHVHEPLVHRHPHHPDLHHRHRHGAPAPAQGAATGRS